RRPRSRRTRRLRPRPGHAAPRAGRRRWPSPPRARAGRAEPGVDGPLRAARRRAGRAARRRRARLGAREAPAGRARDQPLTSQRQTTETGDRDASEKNAGRYGLDEKTCGLKDKATDKIPDFVFGLPFPQIDKADPKAGCKIAWNFAMAGAMGGGGGATFTLNGVDTGGQFRRIKAFIHTRGYQGRHFGPLKDNPESLSGEAIAGALEPVDVEGVSTLTKRYWNWDGQDAVW